MLGWIQASYTIGMSYLPAFGADAAWKHAFQSERPRLHRYVNSLLIACLTPCEPAEEGFWPSSRVALRLPPSGCHLSNLLRSEDLLVVAFKACFQTCASF